MEQTQVNDLLLSDFQKKAATDVIKAIKNNIDLIVEGGANKTIGSMAVTTAATSAALISLATILRVMLRDKEPTLDEKDIAEAAGYAISFVYWTLVNSNKRQSAPQMADMTGEISKALLRVLPQQEFKIGN
jgi:hypothetical protein